MFNHPAMHLDIARLRQQDELARAERYRLARALCRSATPQLPFVVRWAALVCSSLRLNNRPVRRTVQDRPGRAEA